MSSLQIPSSSVACMPYDKSRPNGFGYQPSLEAGVVFTVLFLGTFITHIWQMIRHKQYWLGAAFILGSFGELLGWVARLAANPCPYSTTLLEMQIATLIMAPAFTTAGIYGILALVVPIVGQDKSPLSPRLYLIIFMLVDFFSGSLQAIGGGLAAAAFSENEDPKPGTYTMLAGIAWQLAGTVVFSLLLEFVIIRARHDIWHNPHLVRVLVATMLSITCVVVRGIYRTMELSEGWRGYLITHERFTVALDASMIFVSLSVFNIWNPGCLIPRAKAHAEAETNQNQTAGNDRFEVGRK